MRGMPRSPPSVPTVAMAEYNRPDDALSMLVATSDRRVMLAPEPSTVTAKPNMRTQRVGPNATRSDPVDRRRTLPRDKTKALRQVPIPRLLERNISRPGSRARNRKNDMIALRENSKPTYMIIRKNLKLRKEGSHPSHRLFESRGGPRNDKVDRVPRCV